MLRSRSRAVTTKQALMADHNTSQPSTTKIHHRATPISSFFNSPRFRAFTSKINPFESDCALISPTSIIDTKASIFAFSNTNINKPFCCHESTNPKSLRFQSLEGGGIGLADLVSTTSSDNEKDNPTKPINKVVLFGSKVRVQLHELHPNTYQNASPKPPGDFGTKTRDSRYQGQGHFNSCVQAKVMTGCISVSEMELSEDYTCVTSHGPNPKTTHIFDNCIVMGSYFPSSADKANNKNNSAKLDNFLGVCYTCKKDLDQKHDIYIYRGEKAFCSSECRYREMLLDEMES